tara:strand:+ start:32 stop:553 length:522 start_codon:yes stop_codon:yes gene_type:complete
MKKFNQHLLKFVGLKDGNHEFEYDLDNKFFLDHGYTEFNKSNIKVTVHLTKKVTVMELNMSGLGLVNINCTLSNEPFDYKIDSKFKILVKFGDNFDDPNDELLVIPHGSHTLELDQFFYEMIVLSMPMRNVHPEIENGNLKPEILNRLKEFDINKEKSSNFDPRWNKLKELKK